jgi:hypothetical protein
MRFAWDSMPEILASRREIAVQLLIACRTQDESNFLRGEIAAYDQILRLPADAEEDQMIKEQNDA